MTRLPGVLIDSCPWVLSLISVPRGMIIVGKFAWSPAALTSHPPSPDESRWQRIEVLVVLALSRIDEQRRLIVPLVVEDVDARIDGDVLPRLLDVAAHFVVKVRVRAPAGVPDRGDGLALTDALPRLDQRRVAVRVNRHEAVGMIDDDNIAEPP